MADRPSIHYEVTGRTARLTLDRPERGNAITRAMIEQLAACVERADLDPEVHVLLLSGNGSGFCGGCVPRPRAEGVGAPPQRGPRRSDTPAGPSPGPAVVGAKHAPRGPPGPPPAY